MKNQRKRGLWKWADCAFLPRSPTLLSPWSAVTQKPYVSALQVQAKFVWWQWSWHSFWKAMFTPGTLRPPPPAEVKEAQEKSRTSLHLEKIEALKTDPKQHATNQGTLPSQKQILASPAFVVPIFSSRSLSSGDLPDTSLLPKCTFPRSHGAPENSFIEMQKWIYWVITFLFHSQHLRQWELRQKSQIRAPSLKHTGDRLSLRANPPSSGVCFLPGLDRVGCCVIRWKVQVKSGWNVWLSSSPFSSLNVTFLIHQIRSLPPPPCSLWGISPLGRNPKEWKEWTRSALSNM